MRGDCGAAGLALANAVTLARSMSANLTITRPDNLGTVWTEVERLLIGIHQHHQPLLGFQLLDDWSERQRSNFDPAQPEVLLVLARLGSEAVGVLNGRLSRDSSIFRETIVEIDNVFVVPEQRGSGIAHLLVEDAATWARARGATEMRLSVVAGNTVAERFYEQEGFTVRAHHLTKRLDGQS